jgi:DNA-binding CsgD family transcriptional regulator
MLAAEQLSLLIGDIYDAALDPSLWVGVLAKCAQFVGGPAAALFSKDVASKTGNLVHDSGVDERYKQLYLDKYIKFDPTTVSQFFAGTEELLATADVLPYDEFLKTRFYLEWARPQGLVDSVTSVLEKSRMNIAMFCVFRGERDGRVDDKTRGRMRLIVPHIRRAVLIGRVIDLKTAEAASFADTLDGLSAGMLLVDAHGRMVHANAKGHALLAGGAVLSTVGRKLAAHDTSAEQALHDVFLAAGSGDAAVGIKGIAVPIKARGSEHYVAHVPPLSSGARRRAGATYTAVAAVFLHKAALDAPSPPEVIAKTYRLTPTELRVLLAVVEVGGIPDVADALGISAETVKTHLGHVYAKTGVNRQADLVKLVAGFSSPLAG